MCAWTIGARLARKTLHGGGSNPSLTDLPSTAPGGWEVGLDKASTRFATHKIRLTEPPAARLQHGLNPRPEPPPMRISEAPPSSHALTFPSGAPGGPSLRRAQGMPQPRLMTAVGRCGSLLLPTQGAACSERARTTPTRRPKGARSAAQRRQLSGARTETPDMERCSCPRRARSRRPT